jgi:hypothetical protein
MQKLAKAILSVMDEVKGIDKSMQVGSGNMAYKGVPDQEVKKIIGNAMAKNGLCLLPIEVDPTTQIDRWEQEWNGQVKQKQSVFTEVKAKYLLLHESGESIELQGYGHGVDSQDKSAGKATTYALKYALLYTFLVPTGKIDDSDTQHSAEIETPSKTIKTKKEVISNKAELPKERFENALKQINEGKYSIDALRSTFELNKTQEKQLKDLETKLNEKSDETEKQ